MRVSRHATSDLMGRSSELHQIEREWLGRKGCAGGLVSPITVQPPLYFWR
jgi:hypothetical protein